MKSAKFLLALVAFTAVAGLAYVKEVAGGGEHGVGSSQGFVGTLTKQDKAVFGFDSNELQLEFHPAAGQPPKYTRKGVPLEEMTAEQKKAALALVKAGTSETGNVAATTIMSLEGIFREQEKNGGDGPQSGLVLLHGLRHPVQDRQVGLAGRGTPPVAELHDGRDARSSHVHADASSAPTRPRSTPGRSGAPNALCPRRRIARELFKSLDEDQKKAAYQAKSRRSRMP